MENISDRAYTLTARVVVLSAERTQWATGPVQPQPLLPGQTGTFQINHRMSVYTSSQIECRLDWFRGDDGRRVTYTHDQASPGGP